MTTGVGAGKARMIIYRIRGFPGLPLLFLKFGHRGEYGKVRLQTNVGGLFGWLLLKECDRVITFPSMDMQSWD
jgi:hypothetical protein